MPIKVNVAKSEETQVLVRVRRPTWAQFLVY